MYYIILYCSIFTAVVNIFRALLYNIVFYIKCKLHSAYMFLYIVYILNGSELIIFEFDLKPFIINIHPKNGKHFWSHLCKLIELSASFLSI